MNSKFATGSELLRDAASIIGKCKLPTLAMHMRYFLDAEDNIKRASVLVSLFSTYGVERPVESVLKFARSFPDIVALSAGIVSQLDVEVTEPPCVADTQVEAALEVTEGVSSLITSVNSADWKQWLSENTFIVQMFCGAITLIAMLFGIDTLVTKFDGQSLLTTATKLAGFGKALKDSWSMVTWLADSGLETLYEAFGMTYIKPKAAKLRDLSLKVDALYKECVDIADRVRTDPFGFRTETAASLQHRFDQLNAAMTTLQAEDRSLYNFAVRMSQIQTYINDLRDIVIDLYKTMGGKQRPVTLWVAGPPNCGKTRLMTVMAQKLANNYKSSVYARTVTDPFWSGYRGQAVSTIDDICQMVDSNDIMEFHMYTSDDAKDVIGAGLLEKGWPYTSRHMILTSNQMYISPPCKLKDMLALNRRRDICIYAYNPDVMDYMEQHNGFSPEDPQWWIEHPTQYYLYNPTYGHTLQNHEVAAGLKFRPNAPFVIRQVTLEEIYECMVELEKMRAEQFRQKLRTKDTKYPVPDAPIQYDASKIFHNQQRAREVPTAYSPESVQSDVDYVDMERVRSFTAASISDAIAKVTDPPPDGMWLAEDGNIYAHSQQRYSYEYVQRCVSRGAVARGPSMLLHFDSRTKNAVLYAPRGDTAMQSNPVYEETKINRSRPLMLIGPPGIGKTYAIREECPDVHEVQEDDQLNLLCGKFLLFDDVTVSMARWRKFKEALSLQYESRSELPYNGIFVTLNADTEVWKNIAEDDKTMAVRRCEVVECTYSLTLLARSYLEPLTTLLDKMPVESRSRLQQTKFSPELQQFMGAISDPVPIMRQAVMYVVQQGMSKLSMRTYKAVKVPLPTGVHYRIILDHDTKPSKNCIVQKWNGVDYEHMSMLEHARDYLLIIAAITKVNNIGIADQTTAVQMINSAQIKNDSSFDEAIIEAPSWKILLTSVNSTIFAFAVDCNMPYDFEMCGEQGYLFGGNFYPIESQEDHEIGRFISRTNNKLHKWKSVEAFSTPSEEDAPKMLPIQVWFDTAAAILDITIQFGAAFNLMLPSGSELWKEASFERARRPQGPRSTPEETEGELSHSRDQRPATYDRARGPQYQREERARRPQGPRPTNDAAEGELSHSRDQRAAVNDRATGPQFTRMQSRAVTFKDVELAFESTYSEPRSETAVAIVQTGPQNFPLYGILYQNQVYFLYETVDNLWMGFVCNYTPQWTICSDFNDNRPRAYLNATIGKKLDTKKFPEADLNSIYAYYGVTGNPYDALRKQQDRDAKTVIDKIIGQPKPGVVTGPDGTRMEGSIDQAGMEFVQRISQSHTFPLHFNGEKLLNCTMLKQRLGITNAHCLDGVKLMRDGKEYSIRVINKSLANDVMSFEVVDKEWQDVSDITNHVVTNAELSQYLTERRHKAALAVPVFRPMTFIMMGSGLADAKALSSIHCAGHIEYRVQCDTIGFSGLTKAGDCGAPVVLMAPAMQRKLVGIHSRGSPDLSVAALLTQEFLHALFEKPDGTYFMAEQTKPNHDIKYHDVPFNDAHTGLTVIGAPKHKPHHPTATKKHRTPLNLESDFEPTVKSIHDPRNIQKRDMLDEALARYSTCTAEAGIFEEVMYAATQIAEDLTSLCVANDLHNRVLTLTESLNGPSKNEYPDAKPIDFSGSAGYPYTSMYATCKTKKDYVEFDHLELLWRFRPTPEARRVQSDINALIAQAKAGILIDTPFVAYSKDECVKLKKIYDVDGLKCRTFFSGPFHYQVAYRKYFYTSLCNIVYLHNDIPVKVGLRSNSWEWHMQETRMYAKSDSGFASDMKNWDGTVPIEFLRAVPYIYNYMYRHTDPDWKPEDDLVRSTLHRAIEGAVVVHRHKVYRLTHAMASGFPGTAIENSLINWMLFYCVWRRLALQHCPELKSYQSFKRCVELAVYGDDNKCAVADCVQSWFNFNTFKDVAAKFGFTVTDAAKQGGDQPDVQPLSELEFLKIQTRREGWIYQPAMSTESLLKQCAWISDTGSYEYRGSWRMASNTEQIIQSITTTFPLMAMQGSDKYAEHCTLMRKALAGTDIVVQIPSYEDAKSRTVFFDFLAVNKE